MEVPAFDAVVLGGGSAGYAAARSLASGGAHTAVVDGARELGGLCILRGCMPTKALLHASELRQSIEAARKWGINAGPVTIDPKAVFDRKACFIEEFAGYRRSQLEAGRFTLFRSKAAFLDPHTLQLENGQRLQARSFVLATGSVVSPPPLPALAEIGLMTSDDAVALERFPSSLIVLGGGAVAVEFAQFFARMGTQVSILQRGPHLLRDFDAEAARELETALRREGIAVHTGTRLLGARRTPNGREILFESLDQPGVEQRLEAAEVFHGLGRSPATASLNLAAAGVTLDGGRIVTNPLQRTSAPHIYAAGDCCGPYDIVHIAIQQGEIAAHNILKPSAPRHMDYRILLSIVFTDPQMAQVGLTETVAKRDRIPYASASYPFNDHGKSMILDAKEGYVKLLASKTTGEILGGTCVGPQAGELIHEVAVAMAARMTVRQFAQVPHYHPTLAEIWTYPAEELADQLLPVA